MKHSSSHAEGLHFLQMVVNVQAKGLNGNLSKIAIVINHKMALLIGIKTSKTLLKSVERFICTVMYQALISPHKSSRKI